MLKIILNDKQLFFNKKRLTFCLKLSKQFIRLASQQSCQKYYSKWNRKVTKINFLVQNKF